MKNTRARSRTLVKQAIVLSAILAAVLLSAPVSCIHAEELDECQQRVVHVEHSLHEAIHQYGPNSKQANRERLELQRAREHCWNEEHRWWDEHEHRWHTARDWNEHDHD
jgi:hypothetical protein